MTEPSFSQIPKFFHSRNSNVCDLELRLEKKKKRKRKRERILEKRRNVESNEKGEGDSRGQGSMVKKGALGLVVSSLVAKGTHSERTRQNPKKKKTRKNSFLIYVH